MDTVTAKIDTAALPIKCVFVAKTKREDWECFEWRVTFSSKSGEWNVPYYCGMGHVEKQKKVPDWMRTEPKPKKPSNDDILHSLILDASAQDMNFSDWCAEFGYSDDSIKALNTYQECVKTGTLLRKHLGRDVVAALAIQLQDH